MRFNRAYFYLAAFAGIALSFSLILALGGYFRAVEKGSGAVSSEKRLFSQLKIFHDQLKRATSPEEAKAAMKLAESLTGYGAESELSQELKKAYAPVLSAFAAKPREAEVRFQLVKKHELMETLVNAYRKEVQHGDIRVRANYLNVLFDTQSSLLNESDEAEQVYLKRNRAQLDSLKSIVASAPDPGLPVRVNAIDSIFQSYERGFTLATKWRAEKTEALARVEKSLPGIAKGIFSGEDTGVDETRRTFLYVCFLSLLISSGAFLTLFLGFKVLRVRSELKLDSFMLYLRAFGSDHTGAQLEVATQSLKDDPDWAPILSEAERAEETFLRSCHNQLAVPRSIQSPFLVVGKDRTIRYWNEEAGALFGIAEGKETGLQDILTSDHIGVKDGVVETSLELVRASFHSLAEDRFDLLVKARDGWQPYQLTSSPITHGPVAGGKVYVWREVKGEADRLDKAVGVQVERVRDLVHKVAHKYEADLMARDSDAPATKAMIGDLGTLKGRIDERELLWKSEAQALIDQVTRQHEILHRLGEELIRIRHEQGEALELVRTVQGGEEHLHDEVCVMERDLERWNTSRKRLLRDLEQQSATLERARGFEERLRTATAELGKELEAYGGDLGELRQYADSAKLHSVNLSLVRDPAHREFASRARAFVSDLSRFVSKAETLGEKLSGFVKAHPGGALAAHLNGAGLDDELLSSIKEEQERLGTQVRRWRESGEVILSGGQKALAILQDTEKKSAVLAQLGETSLLINQQAKGNLERWN